MSPAYNGEWNHVAWTLDNGVAAAFLNGERVTDYTYEHGEGFSNMRDLVIGSRDGFGTVNGLLDEVGLWDAVLTDEEIALLASGPLSFGLPGDVNSDDVTDRTDFDIMATNFGVTGGNAFSLGDANRSGEVELLDFRLIKDFQGCVATGDGFSCPVGADVAAAQAPEPASVAMALLAVAGGWIARARKR